MRLQHLAIVHLVQLVARQDQDVARVVAAHVTQTLADGVGGALEPVVALLGLLGGQDRHEPIREDVELVGAADVLVQALGVELRQHENPADVGVQAVRDGDVDQAVLAGDGDGRLGPPVGEGEEPRAAASPEDDRQQIVVHVARVSHGG